MSFRPAPLNADLVRLQMKQLAGDVEERPALRSDAGSDAGSVPWQTGPDSKTPMSANGMEVAAKFMLRKPPLEVSKEGMPGQPSPAPGGPGRG